MAEPGQGHGSSVARAQPLQRAQAQGPIQKRLVHLTSGLQDERVERVGFGDCRASRRNGHDVDDSAS